MEDMIAAALSLSPYEGACKLRDLLASWASSEHPNVRGGYVIMGLPVMVDVIKTARLVDQRASIGQARRWVEGLRLQFFHAGQPLEGLLAVKLEGQHAWLWRAGA